MKCTEVNSKEALHKVNKRGVPYKYDLNIYRGCTHGCKYCYAVKSHEYLGDKDFEQDIMVKTNIGEVLEESLNSPHWSFEPINIGGVCDSYQPIENQYKLMRDVLKVFIKYKTPIVISTKSDLIIRDLDLIDELAYYTNVNIAVCITSASTEVSKSVEPGASVPEDRFKALCEIAKTRATAGLHVMPILPFLADDERTLETLVQYAKESNADYMLTGVLYLTGGIRKRYLSFIEKEYPQYFEKYKQHYVKGSADIEYKSKVHGYLGKMREKHGVRTKAALVKDKP